MSLCGGVGGWRGWFCHDGTAFSNWLQVGGILEEAPVLRAVDFSSFMIPGGCFCLLAIRQARPHRHSQGRLLHFFRVNYFCLGFYGRWGGSFNLLWAAGLNGVWKAWDVLSPCTVQSGGFWMDGWRCTLLRAWHDVEEV